jgi:signal transduction histidine kinase
MEAQFQPLLYTGNLRAISRTDGKQSACLKGREDWSPRFGTLSQVNPDLARIGAEVNVMADPDQLEQMLINLVRNAAEAVLEYPLPKNSSESGLPPTHGLRPRVVVSWTLLEKTVVVSIEDNGPGLLNPSNTDPASTSFLEAGQRRIDP